MPAINGTNFSSKFSKVWESNLILLVTVTGIGYMTVSLVVENPIMRALNI